MLDPKFQRMRPKHILSHFSKDKAIHGPDGWMTELFLHFFQLLGDEITLVVKKPCHLGKIPATLNATFLVLIPKKDKPDTLFDFRPISLCISVS